MNRILLEHDEIAADGVAEFGGVRAWHVANVLGGERGMPLKTGEVDGLVGTGEILEVRQDPDGGEYRVSVRVRHDEEPPKPWFDLVLAPPRPRVMKRLLPQLAAMGVGRIVLVGAKKVEKDFWGATLLREENWRPLFVEGLMQCGATAMPGLETRRNFRRFLAEELDGMFPDTDRAVAHPHTDGRAAYGGRDGRRLLLAIGPEGGWTDDELALMEERGFRRYSLGRRILRTDTATIAAIAKLNMEET